VVLLGQLGQGLPVAAGGGRAMGQQQRCLEARQVEQQLIGNPARGAVLAVDQALLDGQLQALRVAVATDRQLRAGQSEERPGVIHGR
jgi:hypothetical protein